MEFTVFVPPIVHAESVSGGTVYFSQLGGTVVGAFSLQQVRDAQLHAGSSRGIDGVWVTDAFGLPMFADGLHLVTNAQVGSEDRRLYSSVCKGTLRQACRYMFITLHRFFTFFKSDLELGFDVELPTVYTSWCQIS